MRSAASRCWLGMTCVYRSIVIEMPECPSVSMTTRVNRERSVAGDELGGLEIGDGLPAAGTGVLTRARAATWWSHADRSNSDASCEPATVTP